MQLFRLDSSMRVDGSVTRALADAVEQEWRQHLPSAAVARRDLGVDPLPSLWPDGMTAAMTPENARSDGQRRAMVLAAQLVDELLASDAYLFAVPMYNFSVPQQVKHWIDMIICDPRAEDVNQPLLPGRPAVLVEARGGGYGPGTPREGWDHLTPYVKRMLVDVWGLDLVVVEAELTAAFFNPAMAHLKHLAEQQLTEARAAAAAAGNSVASRLRAAA